LVIIIKLNKLKNISLYGFIHFVSIISSFILSELYFFSTKGVDFPNYFLYIENFLYENIEVINNQGQIYYYLNVLTILLKSSELNSINSINFFNSTIQFTNFIFYLIGTIGLFKLLSKYNYKKQSIYISLSLLHFVPKIIEMRVLLKPEILVFSFLSWIILGIDCYFEQNKKVPFVLSLFPLSLLLTSKGSVAGMVMIFLFFKYLKKINKKNIKELILIFFLFVLILTGISYENFTQTNKNFFEVSTTENYQNVAELNFIYNLNFWDLYFAPELGSHNDSFIGITLFDTFGDYYKVNINSTDHYFQYYHLNFFDGKTVGENFEYGLFLRQHLSLLLALIFYVLLFFYYSKNENVKIYLLSPTIGFTILLLNSLGFPDKNFDPLKGDTLKVSYYAFFIAISFVFLLCELFKKYPPLIKILPLLIFIFFLFLLGFPKSNYANINDNIDSKIELSIFCEPLTMIFENSSTSDCDNIVKKSCEYSLYSNYAQNIEPETVPDGFTRVYREDTVLGEIVPNSELQRFIEEGGYSISPVLGKDELKYINNSETLKLFNNGNLRDTNSVAQCKNLISQGYRPYNDIPTSSNKIPFVNLFALIVSIYSFISLAKEKNK
jgi:hypothetical protein